MKTSCCCVYHSPNILSSIEAKVGFSFLVNCTGKLFTQSRPSLKDVAGNTAVTLSQIRERGVIVIKWLEELAMS